MAKLFDFEKQDNDFVESACDPGKRKALIRRLEKSRRAQSRVMSIMLVLCFFMLILSVIGDFDDFDTGAISLLLLLLFMVSATCDRLDIQVKSLKTIDRMESSEE